ncbi:MAG: OmpA family protein [Elusimicrobiaceae bacterium]|nr:OmpA family protein [Elusimicrobiaceae bacterium]
MKKVLVLLGSVLMAGCFICHKTAVQTEPVAKKGIVEQQSPVNQDRIISRYSIPEVANFAFGSKEIRADMNKMGDLQKDIRNNPDAIILVEGHTDNIGTDKYNKALSLERARSVAEVIAQDGYPNQIRVYGAGSSAPIASNDTAAGRAQNRRVDVVLLRDESK